LALDECQIPVAFLVGSLSHFLVPVTGYDLNFGRLAYNDLCLWRLRLSKHVFVPDTRTKLRNVHDIGNGPPQLT
jgi:hypothetical protein